jgi:hypothetical protein
MPLADPEAVAPAISIGFDVYTAMGGLISAILSWLAMMATRLINAKVKNQYAHDAMARFNDSLFAAVKMVHQTARDDIQKAKSPDSPGGEKITKGEADALRDHVWAAIKSDLGGMSGLAKLLSVFGVSEGEHMEKWVNSRIESAVHDVKKQAPGA